MKHACAFRRCRHTAAVMVQLWALTVPLGYGGVAFIGQLCGLTVESMTAPDRVRLPWALQNSTAPAAALGGFPKQAYCMPYKSLV